MLLLAIVFYFPYSRQATINYILIRALVIYRFHKTLLRSKYKLVSLYSNRILSMSFFLFFFFFSFMVITSVLCFFNSVSWSMKVTEVKRLGQSVSVIIMLNSNSIITSK